MYTKQCVIIRKKTEGEIKEEDKKRKKKKLKLE